MTYMACAPEQAAENLQLIGDVQHNAEAEGITEEELAQAQAKVCSQIVLRSERPSSRLFAVGGGWIQRQEYLTVRESVDSYRNVTVDDVNAVLKKYPLSENMTVAVGPLEALAPV